MYSYSIDSEGRIISVAPGDLSGCSDWYYGDIGLTNNSELWDEHGAALYRLEDGRAVSRSTEERMAEWPEEPEPEATTDDYVAALAELGVEA